MSIDWLSWPILLVLIGTGMKYIVSEILLSLNHILSKNGKNESTYSSIISAHPLIAKFLPYDKYEKSLAYEKTNYMFGSMFRNFKRLIGVCMLTVCAWPHLFSWLQSFDVFSNSMVLTIIAATTVFSIVMTVIMIPFDLYNTFVIEAKFGFNTQTFKTWIIDLFKSLSITTALNATLTAACYGLLMLFVNFISPNIKSVWFIGGAIAFNLALGLFYESLYINVIAPIFNKFTKLEDKELEKQIINSIVAAGFSVSGIYVMDAGKRSKHGNAYFCGWGRCKRIVLYDVLLENHTKGEILAILNHEIGHLVHHDILKGRIQNTLLGIVTTVIAVNLASDVSLYHTFGFIQVTSECIAQWYLIGFSLASLVIGSVLWILDPFDSWLSRRAEYAADTYAKMNANGEDMKTALVKLSANNLSNFNIHPWYEFWFYDHPSLKNRLRNLDK